MKAPPAGFPLWDGPERGKAARSPSSRAIKQKCIPPERNAFDNTIRKQWTAAMMPPEPCGARRPGAALPPLRDLQAAGGDRRPAGRRAHRCAGRDGRRAEVIQPLADGPRSQSLGRGARSRVEAEDGLHAATRGDRAGQRREAYAAGIEATVVSDRDVPSSRSFPVTAFFYH